MEVEGQPNGAIVIEEDEMSEDGSVDLENESEDELDGEGDAEGELEQGQDEDIEMGDEMEIDDHPKQQGMAMAQ